MRPSLPPALAGLMSPGLSPQSGDLAPPRLRSGPGPSRRQDIYGRSRSEVLPALPPGCARRAFALGAAPAPGAAELHGLLVAELHSALEQQHARFREQRDVIAKHRELLPAVPRCLVRPQVHRSSDSSSGRSGLISSRRRRCFSALHSLLGFAGQCLQMLLSSANVVLAVWTSTRH